MAVPTVFIGIVCYSLFSRRGPLGATELLYTPWAIVFGEVLLALPIIISLSHGAVRALDVRVSETAVSLGASTSREWWTLVSEARLGVVLAVLTAERMRRRLPLKLWFAEEAEMEDWLDMIQTGV